MLDGYMQGMGSHWENLGKYKENLLFPGGYEQIGEIGNCKCSYMWIGVYRIK